MSDVDGPLTTFLPWATADMHYSYIKCTHDIVAVISRTKHIFTLISRILFPVQ